MAEGVTPTYPATIDVREKLKKAERYGPSRLISIFPLDNADGTLDLIYVFQHNEEVVQYRYTVPAEGEIESLTDLYKGALNMEREQVDLFGMNFKGIQPGLFLTEGSPKRPLRKPLRPSEAAKPPEEAKKDA
ncbi:MAG: NADH-quinone oxidoreductase subunit C [Methanomassiliicoccales archaeon]|jgi:NADH:ubiquinone oxidoreductase subunit C